MKTYPKKEYTYLALSCVICHKELENLSYDNHPVKGLEFTTVGHYGTSVFDPMDGSKLAINICDPCLLIAIERRSVGLYQEDGFTNYKEDQ